MSSLTVSQDCLQPSSLSALCSPVSVDYMFYNSDDCSYKPQIILYKLCNKRFGANLKYYPVCTCLPMSCLFTASFNVLLSPIRYYEATILCVKVSLSKLTDCKQIKCAVPQVCYDGQGYVSRITIIQQLSSRLSEALVQYPYLLFSFIHLNYAV